MSGRIVEATLEGLVAVSVVCVATAAANKDTGKVMGVDLVATCDTYREGKLTKSGTPFMGGFGPANAPAVSKQAPPQAKRQAKPRSDSRR